MSAAVLVLTVLAAWGSQRDPAQADEPQLRMYLPVLVKAAGGFARPPTARATPEPTGTTTSSASPTATTPPSLTPSATGMRTDTATPTGSATSPLTAATPTPSATVEPSATSEPISPTPATPTLTLTPTLTPTPGPPSDVAGLQVFGNEPDFPGLLNQLDGAKARWVRVVVEWQWIEPVAGQREWGYLDGVLGALAARGYDVVAVVMRHPQWLPAPSTGCYLAPSGLDDFRAFMNALAERYDGDGQADAPGSPRVGYWEIGNEPDFSPSQAKGEMDYGSCFGDDPIAYSKALAMAWDGVKAAAPTAQVVFGAVAYDRFHDKPDYLPEHRGPFRYHFVSDVLRAIRSDAFLPNQAAKPWFDVMALHSYNDFRDNWDGPAGQDPELVGKVRHFRNHQLAADGLPDYSAKPLIASEVSLASAPPNRYMQRSEDYQSAYVGRVMARSLAAGLQAAIWYVAEDYPGGDCANPDAWQLFGLLRSPAVATQAAACASNPLPGYRPASAHEPKPAFGAFRRAAELLAEARYGRQLTAFETGSTELEAHQVTLANGRAALVAFTDHGAPLGKITGGRPLPDVEHDLVVGPALLDGWTGRLRIIDGQGQARVESGATVTVHLDYRPQYLVVEP